MIVDYIPPQFLPDIIVWMDWQLYAQGWLYIVSLFFVLLFRYGFTPEEYRKPLNVTILIHTGVFFVICYWHYGPGVG